MVASVPINAEFVDVFGIIELAHTAAFVQKPETPELVQITSPHHPTTGHNIKAMTNRLTASPVRSAASASGCSAVGR